MKNSLKRNQRLEKIAKSMTHNKLIDLRAVWDNAYTDGEIYGRSLRTEEFKMEDYF